MNINKYNNSDLQWRQSLLQIDSTIQDAIVNLDKFGNQIAVVVNKEDSFIGTITDGDIRRGLLKGLKISSSIETIVHHDALVAPKNMNKDMAIKFMQNNNIRQLPVIDNNNKVIDLYFLDKLSSVKKKTNLVMIMAGGMGTRLRPYTNNCPKPMLPVSGKPILEHIIERTKAEGFYNIVISTFYLGHMIENYFGNGDKWKVNISYTHEKKPLGTAGAISLINKFPTEPFVVINGDVLTDIQYSKILDFHTRNSSIATMAVRQYEMQHQFGVVQTKGVEIIGFEEKPIIRNHINAGVYVLDPLVRNYLKPDELCNMPDLFKKLKNENNSTLAFPMHEPWLDVGKPDDLDKAEHNSLKEL